MAAYYGNVDGIGSALQQGGDVEELDPKEQWRPLHAATFTDSVDAVRYLLRMRADANAPGPHGQSALHIAARDNSNEIVEILLKGGADPGMVDAEGRTPAALAAERGSSRTLALLPQSTGGTAGLAAAEAPPQPATTATLDASTTSQRRSSFGASVTPMSGVGMLQLQAQSAAQAAQPAVAKSPDVAEPAGAVAATGSSRSAPKMSFGSAVDPDIEENNDDGVEDLHKGWTVG